MFKMIDTIRNPKGFTLIEVVIALSVGLIGALGGYALLANTQSTIAGNSAAVQAQQDARIIVERMARELRESSPERVWAYSSDEGSNWVYFETPRDENRTFVVDADGKPQWQRGIEYLLGPDWKAGEGWDQKPTCLHRFEYYMSGDQPFQWETVSRNVERVRFSRDNDMITISIRTFSDQSESIGHVADTYADVHTTVTLRN